MINPFDGGASDPMAALQSLLQAPQQQVPQQQVAPQAPTSPLNTLVQAVANPQTQQAESQPSVRGIAPDWTPDEGAQRNPWAALSQALGHLPAAQELARRDQEQQIYQQEQRKAAKEQFAMQTAQQKLPMIQQMLQSNPSLASNPEMVKNMVNIYRTLGIPAPVKTDGTIDLEQLKPAYPQIDLQTQKYIDSLPPEQRKVVLDKYSGVPKEAYTNTAFVTAKDQATMDRNKILGQKEADYATAQSARTKLMGERLALQAKSLAEKTNLDLHREAALDAQVNRANADAARATAEAAAIPQRLNMEQQRLQGQLTRWKDLTAKGSGGSRSAMTTALAQSRAVTNLYNQYQGKYDSLLNSLTAAQANGADEQTISALQEQISKIKTSMDGLDQAQRQVTDFITSGAGNLVTGGSITSSTGYPTEVVSPTKKTDAKPLGAAPPGVRPGVYNVRGQLVEVRSDGNYYPVSQ
jgi:hypothetical protein